MKRSARIGLTVLFTGLALGYLVWKIDLHDAVETILGASLWWFGLSVAIMMLAALPMALRWQWLMEMHLYYFTYKTLEKMLERTGFRAVRRHDHVRDVRLNYLVSRLEPYSKSLARAFLWIIKKLRIESNPVSIPFSGLKTIYARKI